MDDDEIRKRIRNAVANDIAGGTLSWVYLSFAAERFLGGCLVRAYGFADAIAQAHRLGINPGGSVHGSVLKPNFDPPEGSTNRLLSKEELEQLFGPLTRVPDSE